ncbi:putative transitional endoplasmic reticulum ATPase [Cardiosporidium cionae]|uniref:Transitional endoplasmic reticulum ATPase n=1 Tax=Cardiosporidium cionae TaxID=476202 RepID=A0ABQ7JG89_9APIC|nr:putative transitional endoplasmic reticulum ATPase [Cardiosporidium cionae]|eukprot:KAF8823003.1 putative transitional endoplasmic reticulum ATPase [Cardiosporidium cionae]
MSKELRKHIYFCLSNSPVPDAQAAKSGVISIPMQAFYRSAEESVKKKNLDATDSAPATISLPQLREEAVEYVISLLLARFPYVYSRVRVAALRKTVSTILNTVSLSCHNRVLPMEEVAQAVPPAKPISLVQEKQSIPSMNTVLTDMYARNQDKTVTDSATVEVKPSNPSSNPIPLANECNSTIQPPPVATTSLPDDGDTIPRSPNQLLHRLSEQLSSLKQRKRMRRVERDAAEDTNISSASRRNFQPEIVTGENLADLGALEGILCDIQHLVILPLRHPELLEHLGISPPRGILLHGPPGSGKTKLACAIAGEVGCPFFRVAAPEIVTGMSGESEALLRSLFETAKGHAPCIIFIDEIDAISPKRESSPKEMERRIVAQLGTCMDELNGSHVVVLGATNRIDSLDPMIRRSGRFDREIAIGIPDEAARKKIILAMCKKVRLSENVNFDALAKLTPGFVGADLYAVTVEASLACIARVITTLPVEEVSIERWKIQAEMREQDILFFRCPLRLFLFFLTFLRLSQSFFRFFLSFLSISQRISLSLTSSHYLSLYFSFFSQIQKPYSEAQLSQLFVEHRDFEKAVKRVQPSAKREGFSTIPDVCWEDVGALSFLRKELVERIVLPIKECSLYKYLGLDVPAGVLLYGPPGCGKTLLAKAVANESGANFIAVKGPELLNKYVGESEKAVRLLFQRAHISAPCMIFFDELDSLCSKRGLEGNQTTERVVNQLLTEMDGIQDRKEVYVIAATNRPDIIDPAMLRPGRLDRLLYVPLPTEEGRFDILQTLCRKIPVTDDVDLHSIAASTHG